MCAKLMARFRPQCVHKSYHLVCVCVCALWMYPYSNWCTQSPWCTRCKDWRCLRHRWFRLRSTKTQRRKRPTSVVAASSRPPASSTTATIGTNSTPSTLSISTLHRSKPQHLLRPLLRHQLMTFPYGIHRSPTVPLPIPWTSNRSFFASSLLVQRRRRRPPPLIPHHHHYFSLLLQYFSTTTTLRHLIFFVQPIAIVWFDRTVSLSLSFQSSCNRRRHKHRESPRWHVCVYLDLSLPYPFRIEKSPKSWLEHLAML